MKFILFVTIFLLTLSAYSQDLPGKRDSIFSEVLKEKRIIQVILPDDYKPGARNEYDVLYLLDGSDNLALFHQIQQLAEREKYVPKLIVVAVINTVRNRDLTPTSLPYIKNSGGAANFLSFFKQELIPYINKTYPAKGENILYGHSFGGLFVTYAMLHEPQLFASYIAVDPSFWYDGGYTKKLAIEKLAILSNHRKTLFITGREGALKDMGIDIIDSVLKVKAPADLAYKVVAYEDESHGSVRLKSMYDGLKMVYKDYRLKDEPIEFHPMNGIVLKDKPFLIYHVSDLPDVRYNTNAAVDITSTKIERVTTFTGPMTLNLKSFTSKGLYDKTASGIFAMGEAPAPIAKPAKCIPGGLSYKYFQGNWDKIPDFKKLKPSQSGIADKDFNFTKLPSKTNFACVFEGIIEIKEEGYYILGLDSDDGAKLHIKNQVVINYDGLHNRMSYQSYLMPLKKGFYPVKLEYFQKEDFADLRLKYMLPGGTDPIDIPYEVLYSVN